ncbi:MAG: hypothetical protein MK081_06905 [Flavobacteriales bacterium]|nr:hypothetical protein [Flavobacteriales bacterium]
MNVPFFISRRYLFSKKSRNIINVISGISMLVVAAVTTAMITILSAFNGIESLVADLFTSFDAEITVTPAEGKVFAASDSLINYLQVLPEIDYISRTLEDDVIIRYDGQPSVATLLGVDTVFKEVTDIEEVLAYGDYNLDRDGLPCAITGYGIQSELGIPFHPEDYSMITLSAPIRGKKLSRYKEKALNTMPILISAVFSVNAELDVKYIIAPLDYAKELFDYDTEVSQLSIAIAEGIHPEDAKEVVMNALGEGYLVQTRYDKNALVHQTNRSEKWATFLILAFIMIIAAFNIMASLTMLIIEKRKDIFILQSFGLTATDIRRIFSNQGILINVIGAGIGLFLGLSLCLLQQYVGILRLQGSIVEFYPVEIRFLDVIGVMATVLIIGSVFSSFMVRYLIKRFAQ